MQKNKQAGLSLVNTFALFVLGGNFAGIWQMYGLKTVWNKQLVQANPLLLESRDECRDIAREVKNMSKGNTLGKLVMCFLGRVESSLAEK